MEKVRIQSAVLLWGYLGPQKTACPPGPKARGKDTKPAGEDLVVYVG